MVSFILQWGHTNESIEYLENELLTRGVVTKKRLTKILNSCDRVDSPDYLRSEYKQYQYWVELAKMCEDYDWNLYVEHPVDHGINYVHFVFDVCSSVEPIYQYPYGSIYEYVAYMENAIVSLKYSTLDEIRNSFYNNINAYASFLESFAKECDKYIMNNLEYELWFNPMRRYNQIQFNTDDEKIQFLEFHVQLRRANITKKANKYKNDNLNYITMLQSSLYRLLF